MADDLINQAALDRFTSAHAGVGVTMAVFNVPWWGALGISVAWEIVENWLKDQKSHLFPYSSHDSAENSVADTIAVVLGFATTRHLMRRGLTDAGKAALGSAVGATLGAFVGSASIGLAGRMIYGEQKDAERGKSPVISAGRTGYMVGCGMGGAVGGIVKSDPKFSDAAGLGGIVGGVSFGPLGAALGTYLAVGVAEDVA